MIQELVDYIEENLEQKLESYERVSPGSPYFNKVVKSTQEEMKTSEQIAEDIEAIVYPTGNGIKVG